LQENRELGWDAHSNASHPAAVPGEVSNDVWKDVREEVLSFPARQEG
jgi:hypothetical protein